MEFKWNNGMLCKQAVRVDPFASRDVHRIFLRAHTHMHIYNLMDTKLTKVISLADLNLESYKIIHSFFILSGVRNERGKQKFSLNSKF